MINRQQAFFAFAFSLLAILFLARQESVQRYGTEWQDNLKSALAQSWPRTACQTNPFTASGYLNRSEEVLSENRWVPYDKSCSTPDLFSSIVQREPIPWLQKRTIVLFGDATAGNHTEWFCKWAGGKKVAVYPGDELSPSMVEPLDSEVVIEPFVVPSYCHLPEYDFYLVSVPFYGVDLEDSFSKTDGPGGYLPPGRAEERVDNVLLPFLRNLQRPSIDLIEVASFEWDLRLSSLASDEPDHVLKYMKIAHDWLPFYQFRMKAIANHILEAFPHRTNNYPIIWRLPHMPRKDLADDALLSAAMLRATEYTFGAEEWRGKVVLDPIGKMLLGGERLSEYMEDDMHPTDRPLGIVWFNYILWQLRKAVIGA